MRKFIKAEVPLFAIILTLLALGTMAFKGVVIKKGVETSKVVLAEQWYSIAPADPLLDLELQTNQKITDEDSEPFGVECNRLNLLPKPICGVAFTFTGDIPDFSMVENKTVKQVLDANPGSSVIYTRKPN